MEPVEFAERKGGHIDIAARTKNRKGLHEILPCGAGEHRCGLHEYSPGHAMTSGNSIELQKSNKPLRPTLRDARNADSGYSLAHNDLLS
jgi:hypothetical protein